MYSLISHVRPKGLDQTSLRPFSVVNPAQMPGLESDGDTWARANLRLFPDPQTVARLGEIWNRPGCVRAEEFFELKEKAISLLPPECAHMVEPGVRFGVPGLKLNAPVWFDLFHEICTERFRDEVISSGLTGLEFHYVRIIGGKMHAKDSLFCIKAEFSALSDRDQCVYDRANVGFDPRILSRLEDATIILPGSRDFYRTPYMYGGFLASEKAREALGRANVDSGIRFLPMRTD